MRTDVDVGRRQTKSFPACLLRSSRLEPFPVRWLITNDESLVNLEIFSYLSIQMWKFIWLLVATITTSIFRSYIYELSRLNSLNESFYTVRDINTSFVWTLRVESNGSKWVIKCLFFAMFNCNGSLQTLGLTCRFYLRKVETVIHKWLNAVFEFLWSWTSSPVYLQV